MSGGHIELERTISSIVIGVRHRTDLGDIDALAASIARDGLLQPPTITPDGVLVCGRRRLAAIQQLGWRTVNVWVRSGISNRLGHLLAEQDDNVLHKPLTPVEAATLYRELKELMAEDAARRQQATRFSSTYQPGDDPRGDGANDAQGPHDGGANLAPPSQASGKTRQQVAAMIPGAPKHATLDKIEFIQQAATRPGLSAELQAEIATALAQIDAGAPVHPLYERIRGLLTHSQETRDAKLDALAQEAVARATKGKAGKRKQPAAATPMVWTTRSFLVIWGELENWWTHYDPAVLAAELDDEQIGMFLTVADGTTEFATALRTVRAGDGAERHLRAL